MALKEQLRYTAIFLAVALPFVFVLNYGLAMMEEPRAVWLMRLLGFNF